MWAHNSVHVNVQCGAWTGETDSNTLMFERDYNWTGVLVEADSRSFAKYRHIHYVHILCVCEHPLEHVMPIPVHMV